MSIIIALSILFQKIRTVEMDNKVIKLNMVSTKYANIEIPDTYFVRTLYGPRYSHAIVKLLSVRAGRDMPAASRSDELEGYHANLNVLYHFRN